MKKLTKALESRDDVRRAAENDAAAEMVKEGDGPRGTYENMGFVLELGL
jgi:hypothetical protein